MATSRTFKILLVALCTVVPGFLCIIVRWKTESMHLYDPRPFPIDMWVMPVVLIASLLCRNVSRVFAILGLLAFFAWFAVVLLPHV